MNTYYSRQKLSTFMQLAMRFPMLMPRMMMARREVSLSSFHPPRLFFSE